jgi:signal transduction histidine kinase
METAMDPTPRSSISILVIDDETGLREMLTYGLSSLGFRVVTAEDGHKGLELALTSRFDVIVCDLMMPTSSGMDVLRQLREARSEAQFIMSTGHATLETAIESIKLGAYDYITKPYSLKQLLVIIERAVETRRLRSRVVDLEVLDQLKSQFLSNTSHELRTPLNAIMGFVSLLLNGVYGELSDHQVDVLTRADANTRRLLQIVMNLLDLSKLAAGSMPVHTGPCDLAQLCQTLVRELRSMARDKNLAFTYIGPKNLEANADNEKIRQVLNNLLLNALKFTARGAVTLSLGMSPDQGFLEFSVADTGIGIAPESIPSLFRDFQQVDASTTRKFGGTGIGLSISEQLARLMGGHLDVQSIPSQGSTFTLRLPAKSTLILRNQTAA